MRTRHIMFATCTLLSAGSAFFPRATAQCAYEVVHIIEPPPCPLGSGGMSSITGVNNDGWFVGDLSCLENYASSWMGEGTQATVIPMPPGAGGQPSCAEDINNAGLVTGSVISETGGFLFDGVSSVALPRLEGTTGGVPKGMNDRGDIVGFTVPLTAARAVMWRDGEPVDLHPFLAADKSRAFAVNSHGHCVGWRKAFGDPLIRPYLYDETGLVEIPNPDPTMRAEACLISDNGIVAGLASIADDKPRGFIRPMFIWESGEMTLVMPSGVYNDVIPRDMNGSGAVVGLLQSDTKSSAKFIWTRTNGLRLIHPLILPDDRYTITGLDSAPAIADNGTIAVEARINGEWPPAILILAPVEALPTDLNADCVTGTADLLLLLIDWGKGESAADFNHDGVVNVADLLFLLSHWG